MPDTMTRGPRTGQQSTVVPRGPSPIVATAVFLTSLVVVVCVVVAAVLLWRAPRDGNDAAADAQRDAERAVTQTSDRIDELEAQLAATDPADAAAVNAASGALPRISSPHSAEVKTSPVPCITVLCHGR